MRRSRGWPLAVQTMEPADMGEVVKTLYVEREGGLEVEESLMWMDVEEELRV